MPAAFLYNTTLLPAIFDLKMTRMRVLQQALALSLHHNSLTIAFPRQQVLSPALSVARRPIMTTVSLLQDKEPEAPASDKG